VIEGDAGLETTNNGCCCFPFAALVGAGTVLTSPAEPCSVLSLIIALPQLPVGSKPSSESQARARRANHSAPANSPDLCAALCCHVMRSKAMRREGNAMQCKCKCTRGNARRKTGPFFQQRNTCSGRSKMHERRRCEAGRREY
jgi:hypothetical protein